MKNALWAVFILFSDLVFCVFPVSAQGTDMAAALSAAQSATVPGSSPVFTGEDRELMESLQEYGRKHAGELKGPELLQVQDDPRFQAFRKEAENLTASLRQDVKTVHRRSGNQQYAGTADPEKQRFDTLVFASFSLPEDTLREIYRSCAGQKNTAIVFRGLPEGCHTINDAIRRMQGLAVSMKLEVPPNAVINPVWFREYAIDSVPAILALEENTAPRSADPETGRTVRVPEVIASVRGLADPAWLRQRIGEGRKGFLGVMGPVSAIQERDLVEEMIARAQKVDWQEKKRQALSRVWQNLPVTELTQARAWRKRLIDPSFTVSRDIPLPDGRFLARKGERINPLDRRAFDRLLVVFNGTDQREIAFVKEHLAAWTQKSGVQPHNVRLILTGIDRDRGWDSYKSLTNYFDDEVFLLTPEIRDSFLLEHTPCTVAAAGRNFVVEEYAPD